MKMCERHNKRKESSVGRDARREAERSTDMDQRLRDRSAERSPEASAATAACHGPVSTGLASAVTCVIALQLSAHS